MMSGNLWTSRSQFSRSEVGLAKPFKGDFPPPPPAPAPPEFCRKEMAGVQCAQVQAPPGSVNPCSPGTVQPQGSRSSWISSVLDAQQEQGQAGRGRGWIPQPEAKHQGTAMGTGHGTALCPKRILPSRSVRASHPKPTVVLQRHPALGMIPQPPQSQLGTARDLPAAGAFSGTILTSAQAPGGSSRLSRRSPAISITAGPLECKITSTFFFPYSYHVKKYLVLCIQVSITLKHDVLVIQLWKRSRAFHLVLQPLLRYRVTPESHLGEL